MMLSGDTPLRARQTQEAKAGLIQPLRPKKLKPQRRHRRRQQHCKQKHSKQRA
jgi:hypothetical protein